MPSCSVLTCRNNNCRTKSEVKYYKFPKVEEYCIKWYLACGRPIINLKFATVCSQHFDSSASHRTKQQEVLNYSPKCYRGLKPDAIPTKKIPWNGISTEMITPNVLNTIREWCLPKVKKAQENVEELKGPKKKHLIVKELLAWFPSDSGTLPVQNTVDIGNTLGKNYVIIQPTGTQNLSESTNFVQQNNQIEQIPLVTVPAVSHSETNINPHKIVLYPVSSINPIDSLKSSASTDFLSHTTTQHVASNNVTLNSKSTGSQFVLIQSLPDETVVNKKLVTNVKSPPLILPDTLKNIPLTLNKQIITHNCADRDNNEINGDSCETSGMTLLRSEFKDMKRTISILRDEIRVWQKQYTEMKESYEALAKDHKCSLMNRKKEVDLAVHAVLSGIFTPGQIKLLLSRGTESRSKKSGVHWTHRDMKTALALRNLSPRAYHYLRTEMNYPLPAPSSLRRFMTMITRKVEKIRPCSQTVEGKTRGETLDCEVISKLVEETDDQTLLDKSFLVADNNQENSCLFVPVPGESHEIVSTV